MIQRNYLLKYAALILLAIWVLSIILAIWFSDDLLQLPLNFQVILISAYLGILIVGIFLTQYFYTRQVSLQRNLSDVPQTLKPDTTIDKSAELNNEVLLETVSDLKAKAELLELSTDTISVYDFSGNPAYLNNTYCRAHGYSLEEMMQMNIRQVSVPESVRVLAGFDRIRKSGALVFENQHRRKDGSIFILELHSRFFKWGDRELILSIGRDITERKNNDELMEQIVQNSPVGMFIMQNDKIIFANQRFARDTGYTQEELVNNAFSPLISPDELPRVFTETNSMLLGEKTDPIEFTGIAKDQSKRSVLSSASTIYYQGKRAILVMAIDITETKNHQRNLQESEARFRRLAENAQDLIYRYRLIPEPGFEYVSSSALAITGYTPEEHYADPLLGFKLVIPEDRHLLEEMTRSPELYYRKPVVLRWLKKDGKIIWTEQRNVPVLDDSGKIIALEGIARDITERKKAEEALLESNRRFLETASLLPQSVWELDARGNFVFWNEAGRKMHGYSADENVNVLELFAPEKRQYIIGVSAALAQGQSFSGFESVGLRKDGTTFPVLIHNIPVFRDGKYTGVRGITIDITERKKADAQERELAVLKELDKFKSELLANVSHELRTPLVAIKGFTSTLLRKDANWRDEQKEDFLRTIEKETDRLTRLINDLLDMARLDAGAFTLKTAAVSPEEILDSIKPELTLLTSRHRLEIDVGRSLPVVNADITRIGQVISNLVDNAVKFSAPGTMIKINVESKGDEVIFHVEDHGIGLKPESILKIFDRFYQVQSSTEGGRTGTGLGLPICKAIIENHDGRIWVESQFGQGSVFHFTLPAAKPWN